jgi:hypothetical protein
MARRTRQRFGANNNAGSRRYAVPVVANLKPRTASGAPNVEYMRPELAEKLDEYVKIEDCMAGPERMKKKAREYLPMPNAEDNSDENLDRYEAYIIRAVFYAVVFRTVKALVGQIFLRDPQQDLPPGLQPLVLDANGDGVSLDQVAKLAARHALSIGRAGLFVDYSTKPTGLTKLDVDSGDYRPIIWEYSGAHIRNWRKASRGSRSVFTLVVLRDEYVADDDGFETRMAVQYKVLRLVSTTDAQQQLVAKHPEDYGQLYDNAIVTAQSAKTDVYMIEVWRSATANGDYGIHETYFPKDANGLLLNEIPFQFIGSEKNDEVIDDAPMAPMAEVNIAHFRNSADYEENVFLIGQPTVYVSGVTEEWNEKVLKGTVSLGARAAIPLPNGGTAGILQALPNTLAYEAMGQKERQMVALGAKLVEQRDTQRTATEAEMESTADTSVLANVAGNVSAAMEWALKTACKFTGDNPEDVTYVLNKEFDLTKMPADARQQLMLEWQADMITDVEMRANLRRGGIASEDDKTALPKLQQQKEKKQKDALLLAKAGAANKAVGKSPAPGSTGNTPGNTKQPAGAKPGSNSVPNPNRS